jgi:hypothetical protein
LPAAPSKKFAWHTRALMLPTETRKSGGRIVGPPLSAILLKRDLQD